MKGRKMFRQKSAKRKHKLGRLGKRTNELGTMSKNNLEGLPWVYDQNGRLT